MESIKFPQAYQLAQMDAHLVSTDVDTYAQKNQFGYYVLTNTWIALAYDLSPRASDILADQLVAYGLIPTIKVLNEDAMEIIHGTPENMTPLGHHLCADLDISKSLQILRFAKRFSPFNADIVASDSLTAFKQTLNSVKMKSRKGYPTFLTDGLKPIIADIVRGYDGSDLALDGFFSSGAVQNTSKSLAAKVRDWWYPYFMDIMYPLSSRDQVWCPEFPKPVTTGISSPLTIDRRTAKAVAVPKSYKAARIIAEEDSTRQWMLQAIRVRLERLIKANKYSDFIALENQGHNQRIAYESSFNMQYATVDLSSASDSLSMALFAEVFPQSVVTDVRNWRSSKVAIEDKVYATHMCATSGSAVCFCIESILFWAIARLATDTVASYLGIECLPPHAYGDDTIIDVRAYDTFVDFLTMLGFTVNEDKSFTWPSLYRESCGVEFWDGVECTSLYWPRKPIDDSIPSIESLVKLHNALYEYWDVHVFLKKCLRRIIPKDFFTTSTLERALDCDPTDLLDPVEVVHAVPEPYGTGHSTHDHLADGHMTIKQRPSGKKIDVPDVYYYVEYLRFGPRYDDPLSEMLRVSTSRVKSDDCYSRREAYLALIKDI